MQHRRAFLRALAGASLASVGAAAAGRPNVLFLSVDDMNDWVGCLEGYPGVRTPHLDALARRGVLFRNAHCTAPLCNPSRTALLTGLRPDTTGIYNNEQYLRPNLPQVVTLPVHFKKDGYYVAGVGKVFHHVAGFNPPDQWHEFELQQFDDPWYRRAEWYPWVKKIPPPKGHPFNGLDGFAGEFDWGVLDIPEEAYGDMHAVRWAEAFLKRKFDQPFFLAVGLWHPHIPMYAPQRYFDWYPDPRLPEVPENDLDDIPKIGQTFAAFRRDEYERIVTSGKWRDAVRAYLACISFADAMVGRILKALESSPHAQNTIIVFWSDNGWHLGEKRHWHKSTLWERATHVPLILAGPGVQYPGRDRLQPVTLLDLYPTLVEMCGLSPRRDLEGKSLVPLLRNPSAKHRPAVITHEAGNHAVRTERWRYIRYHDGSEELYDRNSDPNEWKNLAGDPRFLSVKRELARWIPASSAPPQPNRDQFDFDFETYRYHRRP
ncbi:MAG: sulfatase [Bryobacteraceae bacterium]|nr:sulfatase [Bryobacteraceae bacterium]MDW8378618.1 sulfatase [Bryobacterales bacterium]